MTDFVIESETDAFRGLILLRTEDNNVINVEPILVPTRVRYNHVEVQAPRK
ncbi:MAG: hypothetical protein H5T92_01790 [Synergistales bacterium]|nr:hypothetical protein [Synergistales bacterium]